MNEYKNELKIFISHFFYLFICLFAHELILLDGFESNFDFIAIF